MVREEPRTIIKTSWLCEPVTECAFTDQFLAYTLREKETISWQLRNLIQCICRNYSYPATVEGGQKCPYADGRERGEC